MRKTLFDILVLEKRVECSEQCSSCLAPIAEVQADSVRLVSPTVYVAAAAMLTDGMEFDSEDSNNLFPGANVVPIEALMMKHEEFMKKKYRGGGMNGQGGRFDYGETDGYRLRLDPNRVAWNKDPAVIDISR